MLLIFQSSTFTSTIHLINWSGSWLWPSWGSIFSLFKDTLNLVINKNKYDINKTNWAGFHNHLIRLKVNPKLLPFSDKYFRNVKIRIYSLPMNLHKPFKIWSAIIRINTKGKSLIMKLGVISSFLGAAYCADVLITPNLRGTGVSPTGGLIILSISRF